LHSAVQVTERGAPEGDVDVVLPLTPPRPNANPPAPTPRSEPAPTLPSDPTFAKPPEAASASSTPPVAAASPRPAGEGAAANEGQDPFDQAMQIYRARGYIEAERLFERLSKGGSKHASDSALYAALSARNIRGCGAALGSFERVRARFPGSAAAHEATWRAARCQEQLGDADAARLGYESLLRVATHAHRAEQALATLVGGERSASQ